MKTMETEQLEITDQDQALFEAGIKLGALYHQFIGSPLSVSGISAMEKAIEESIRVQPFVEEITVQIDEKKVLTELNETFRYTELKGHMLSVKITVKVNKTFAFVSLKYDESLKYPLMKIDKIEKTE
ncbi:MAG: dihydroneopterin aldolase family protein [Methanimicrococcus sp.]|nr:dihydroneopterin aldolase family protein [Methanimicrococcus sp.]